MESSTHELSSDMIFEVMSRSCLQTLDSSRLVCKEWNNLTYDPNFIQNHARNKNIVSGYLVQSLVSNKYKSKFVCLNDHDHDHESSSSSSSSSDLSFEFLARENIKIEASSDQLGIFVYVNRQNHRHERYHICKPSTKQSVALPNPKTRYVTEKVALVVLSASPFRYKIIRLSWPSRGLIGYVKYQCEIFDSNIWAWKETNDILLPHGEFLMSQYPAICASGSIYFLTSNDRVLALDQKSELYSIFSLPQPAFENFAYKYKRIRIVKYKGKLGFTCKAPNGRLELWIMNRYGINQPLWEKRLALTTQVLEEKEDYPVLGAFYNSGVALVEGEKNVIFYKIKNHDMFQVKLKHYSKELYAFRSDFEPISLNNRRC